MAVVAALRAPSSPEAIASIRAGLQSTDSRVRAVSARVANAADPSRFVGDLTQALSAESDAEAAREEAWALAIGDPDRSLEVILKAASREGVRDGVLEGLGAAQGARMPAIWPLLPKHLLADWARALVRGTRRTGNIALLAPLLLRDQLASGWRELLSRRSPEPIARGLLLAALDSPSSQIRLDAYIALVGDTGASWDGDRELKAPASRQERMARRLFEAAFGLSSEIEFPSELVPSTEEDAPMIVRLRRLLLPEESPAMARLRKGLTAAERTQLQKWLADWNGDDAGFADDLKIVSESLSPSKAAWKGSTTSLGTPKGLPVGFVEAVLNEWECRSDDRSIVASVVFQDDGRPSDIQMATKPGGKGCGAAAQILFSASFGALPKGRGVLVLPAFKASLECLANASADDWEPRGLPLMRAAAFAADLKEPRKTNNVVPEYSGARQPTQIWGDLEFHAVVTRRGCVAAIEGFRVSDGAQDIEMIGAISRWSYAPLQFRGAPTAVPLRVRASFSLN